MKPTTVGVITAIKHFVAGPDGPVALLEHSDIATGQVVRRMVQLSCKGERLALEPTARGFSSPDQPGTGSFGTVEAAALAFASISAAARSIAAHLALVAPDGIIELASDGDHLIALEAEPDLHDGTRQRLHHLRVVGARAELRKAPDLAALRLSARRSLTGLAVAGGRLFAMVTDPMAGLDVYMLMLADPDAGFCPVLERGAERYMLNAAVSAVAVGPEGLLLGTAALADTNLRVGNWGPELLILTAEGSWDLVIGQPRLSLQGLQIPASGQMPGLGQSANAAIKAIATGQMGKAIATWIVVQRFVGRSVANRLSARPDLFAYRGAARLYVSTDLVDWQLVSGPLPEGIGAITAMHVTSDAILIGHEGFGREALPLTVIARKDDKR